MSFSEPPSKPLAGRQRRWAPKTRTGCSTCRTRRVKCDEQKPICKRCSIAHMPCEGLGYSIVIRDPSKPVALAPKPSARSRSIPRAPPSVPQLNSSADVRDLLALIPQVDKYINESFVENPANAVTEFVLFRGGQLTMYLDFLPSRLGYNSALDRAITCVSSAIRDICLPEGCRSPVKTLSNYAKALNVLQRSLSDAVECLSAEVLCAIHLLGIFESLMRSEKQTTNVHKHGVRQLYQLRGPERFRTDFERALLISWTPIILSDAVFANCRCFLDQPDWMSIIKSVSILDLNNFNFSEFKVSRYEYMIPMGRMVSTCSHVIMNQNSLDNVEELRLAALEGVAEILKISQQWLFRWNSVLHPASRRGGDVFLGKGDSQVARENASLSAFVYGMGLMRFHVALGGENALQMEARAKTVATSLLENTAPQDDDMAAFDFTFAIIAARSFMATTEEWQRYMERTQGAGKMVEPGMWVKFLQAWGASPG